MQKRIVLIIDPQNDFIDDPDKPGSLAVSGAYMDIQRLAKYISENTPDAVLVTQDSHHEYDIGHPAWWVDGNGDRLKPGPITFDDIKSGKIRPADLSEFEHSYKYLENLGTSMVWPEHCLMGSRGWEISETLKSTIDNAKIPSKYFFMKGLNPRTEHYSAIKADYLIDGDPDTDVNMVLIDILDKYDVIEVAGEAMSHCVNRTVRDIISIKPELAKRIVLLVDAMSSVPGFEDDGNKFIEDMIISGCKISETSKKLKNAERPK